MEKNRVIAYMGPRKVEVKNMDFPKLVGPGGRKCDHGVILKIVVTNICGSDQHIYRGRFPAPQGWPKTADEYSRIRIPGAGKAYH